MLLTERISWRAWGWIAPIALTLLAATLRIVRLSEPHEVMFDETYYAKDAWALLQFGYVRDFIEDADEQILAGTTTGLFVDEPSWIVHPDGAKWMIALGIQLFGFDPFGWRIMAAVFGALTVLVLCRLILRLTGSIVIASIGGLLLTLDGTHFVMSRVALLDIFLTFWVVAAVACLAADKDWLTKKLEESQRWQSIRPWQIAAGLCFGAAIASKWSGLYVLAAFGLAIVSWEVLTRYWLVDAKVRNTRWLVRALFIVGLPAFGWIVGIAVVVYLFSWTGWLINHEVYEARFGNGYGDVEPWPHLSEGSSTPGFLDPFLSLWQFHRMTYDFHTGDYLAGRTHPYQSHPIGWIVQWRPVSISVESQQPAELCGADASSYCIQEVLILGNPIVWWLGAVAVVIAIVTWIRHARWEWSIPLVGLVGTWLPWFVSTGRPIFAFYAVTMIPFVIVAICLVLASARTLLSRSGRPDRWWWIGVGVLLAAVIIAFVYFYPIWADVLLPYDSWRNRMWFDRWI